MTIVLSIWLISLAYYCYFHPLPLVQRVVRFEMGDDPTEGLELTSSSTEMASQFGHGSQRVADNRATGHDDLMTNRARSTERHSKRMTGDLPDLWASPGAVRLQSVRRGHFHWTPRSV